MQALKPEEHRTLLRLLLSAPSRSFRATAVELQSCFPTPRWHVCCAVAALLQSTALNTSQRLAAWFVLHSLGTALGDNGALQREVVECFIRAVHDSGRGAVERNLALQLLTSKDLQQLQDDTPWHLALSQRAPLLQHAPGQQDLEAQFLGGSPCAWPPQADMAVLPMLPLPHPPSSASAHPAAQQQGHAEPGQPLQALPTCAAGTPPTEPQGRGCNGDVGADQASGGLPPGSAGAAQHTSPGGGLSDPAAARQLHGMPRRGLPVFLALRGDVGVADQATLPEDSAQPEGEPASRPLAGSQQHSKGPTSGQPPADRPPHACDSAGPPPSGQDGDGLAAAAAAGPREQPGAGAGTAGGVAPDAAPAEPELLDRALDLLARALKGPLLPAQQQLLQQDLDACPGLAMQLPLAPGQLPLLVENTPNLAYELLTRRMAAHSPLVVEHLSELACMELSLHSMEVVNRLSGVVMLPPEFVHQYIANCIRSCEAAQDKYIQNRLVRLVCVFLQSLLRNRILHIADMTHELQSFCINFSRIQEAAKLFRLLKQMESAPPRGSGPPGSAHNGGEPGPLPASSGVAGLEGAGAGQDRLSSADA